MWRWATNVKKKWLRAGEVKAWVQYLKNQLFVFCPSSCLNLREVLSSENKESMGITQESPTSRRNRFTSVSKGGASSLHWSMMLPYPFRGR